MMAARGGKPHLHRRAVVAAAAALLALALPGAVAAQFIGQLPANTVLGNATAATADARALVMPSCPDGSGRHLNWTSASGFSCDTSSSVTAPVGANPTATIGTSAVNGVAATFMRSDAAPAIPQASSTTFGAMKVDNTTQTAAAGVVSTAATTINGTTCTPGSSCSPQGATTPLTAGTSVSLAGPRAYYVCTGTCTVTPPVPVAGYEFCVLNDNNIATVITLAALGSSARYENTARTAYGTAGTGTFVSGGAVGDKVCIVGLDSTHYLTTTYNGTWTAN